MAYNMDGKHCTLKILDALNMYAFLYKPELPNIKPAIKCFYYSIAKLSNNPQLSTVMLSYINAGMPTNSRNELFHWTYQIRKDVLGNVGEYNEFYKYYESLVIDKQFWGNITWYLIHCLAKNCTDFKSFKSLISCLQFVLPCELCRNHLSENLTENHIDKYSKRLFEWSVLLHNTVNVSIDKPVMSLEEAKRIYGL